MANYIKIPLSLNPGRTFASTSVTIAGSRLSGGGTIVAGTTSAAAATTVVPAGGSGAQFTMASTGTAIADVTLTCAAIGDGYKVGDVITVAAIPAAAGKGSASAVMTFTVTAADLLAIEGSATNEYQLIPIDSVLAVDNSSATAANIVTNNYDGNGFLFWIVTLGANQTPANTAANLVADLCDAIDKASQAENSVPVVSFYGGTVVESVVYG
jgi:hypothetical protein